LELAARREAAFTDLFAFFLAFGRFGAAFFAGLAAALGFGCAGGGAIWIEVAIGADDAAAGSAGAGVLDRPGIVGCGCGAPVEVGGVGVVFIRALPFRMPTLTVGSY
jgi:hypothetical protein